MVAESVAAKIFKIGPVVFEIRPFYLITLWSAFVSITKNIYNGIIFPSLNPPKFHQKVRHLDRITCVVINSSNEVMCPLLWEFWIYNFSRRILKGL